MREALAKARQVAAMEQTAEKQAEILETLSRIEAKIDKLLKAVGAKSAKAKAEQPAETEGEGA